MANRRPGWLQGRVLAFASPMTLTVQLTSSGQVVNIMYAEAPLDCRLLGEKVWVRLNKGFDATNDIERRH